MPHAPTLVSSPLVGRAWPGPFPDFFPTFFSEIFLRPLWILEGIRPLDRSDSRQWGVLKSTINRRIQLITSLWMLTSPVLVDTTIDVTSHGSDEEENERYYHPSIVLVCLHRESTIGDRNHGVLNQSTIDEGEDDLEHLPYE